MSDGSRRLERLITAEEGECCAADIDERLDALETTLDAAPAESAADVRALRTLGDDTRYRIVRLLTAAERELCVCEVTPLFDVSESAVSHALSDLVEADLVTRRKDGTWRYYKVTARGRSLLAALDETREAVE